MTLITGNKVNLAIHLAGVQLKTHTQNDDPADMTGRSNGPCSLAKWEDSDSRVRCFVSLDKQQENMFSSCFIRGTSS